MGGYGSLLLAEAYPGWLRAVAAFSPAVRAGDDVVAGAGSFAARRSACGAAARTTSTTTYARWSARCPSHRRPAGTTDGGHTRGYWNRITPAAFAFVAGALTPPVTSRSTTSPVTSSKITS